MQLASSEANYDPELFNQFLNESSRAAQQQLSGDRPPNSTIVDLDSDQNVLPVHQSFNTSAIQQVLSPAHSQQSPMGFSAADPIGKMANEQPQHLLQREEFQKSVHDSDTFAQVSPLESSLKQDGTASAVKNFRSLTPTTKTTTVLPLSLLNNSTPNAAATVFQVPQKPHLSTTTTNTNISSDDTFQSDTSNGILQPLSHFNLPQHGHLTDSSLPNVSKAMQQAMQHRAKMVTFAVNGQPFRPQIRIALLGKEFPQLSHLLDHLTERLGIAVRYLFDLSGHRINSTSLLQHNRAYVASSSARFQPANYARFGQLGSTGFGGSHSSLATVGTNENPLERLTTRAAGRPLSSKNKYNSLRSENHNIDSVKTVNNSYKLPTSPTVQPVSKESQNQHRWTVGSEPIASSVHTLTEEELGYISHSADFRPNVQEQETALSIRRLQHHSNDPKSAASSSDKIEATKALRSRIVTIINRKLPKSISRVLLNVKSSQSIESLIKELGESVHLNDAKVLFAANGQQIRSVSQLKHVLPEIDTFFVDDLKPLDSPTSPINWRQKNFNPYKLNSIQFPKSKLDEHTLDHPPPPSLLHFKDVQKFLDIKPANELEQHTYNLVPRPKNKSFTKTQRQQAQFLQNVKTVPKIFEDVSLSRKWKNESDLDADSLSDRTLSPISEVSSESLLPRRSISQPIKLTARVPVFEQTRRPSRSVGGSISPNQSVNSDSFDNSRNSSQSKTSPAYDNNDRNEDDYDGESLFSSFESEEFDKVAESNSENVQTDQITLEQSKTPFDNQRLIREFTAEFRIRLRAEETPSQASGPQTISLQIEYLPVLAVNGQKPEVQIKLNATQENETISQTNSIQSMNSDNNISKPKMAVVTAMVQETHQKNFSDRQTSSKERQPASLENNSIEIGPNLNLKQGRPSFKDPISSDLKENNSTEGLQQNVSSEFKKSLVRSFEEFDLIDLVHSDLDNDKQQVCSCQCRSLTRSYSLPPGLLKRVSQFAPYPQSQSTEPDFSSKTLESFKKSQI